MKTLLLNLFLFCSVISFGQDRVNKELPKIGKNTIGKLTKATGWHLDEKGQWTSRPNRVTDYLDVLDNEKMGIGMNLGVDNFISYQIKPVRVNSRNYYIFIKKYKDGDEIGSKWKIHKSVEFLVFDSIQFSKKIIKSDTLSLVEINTIHAGAITWPANDTSFVSDIEDELAKRKPNDGFHGWDILFRCRFYKAKNLVQFMNYSVMPKYKYPNVDSAYYETDIANFKNLFGPELHLNFEDLFRLEEKLEIREISMTTPETETPKETNEVYTVVDEMPEFPGGSMEMMKYIQKNLQYPSTAREAGISGKCFLKFIVNPDGSIVNPTLIKSVAGCPDCDKEAIRLVNSMPKWKPAKLNGKPVPVYFNLPINFTIK